MYNIPLFDLNYGIEEEKAVIETIRSKWISMGPKCQELEKQFSELLNIKYSLAVTNCTAALHLACLSLELTSGDEVLCPSLTFAATVNAIKYVGATPVFCDIESCRNLCISPSEIEKKITSRTKAIIVMHYAGFPCNMKRILDIAKKYNLKVIEDACHGPLSEYEEKKLGTIGDVGCFSFFSNKNISSGEGGMVVTNSEELYNKMKLMRSHGMTTMSYQRATGHAVEYDIETLGYNYRLDDIRASLVTEQLKKLKRDLVMRNEIRNLYRKMLGDSDKFVIPFMSHNGFVSNYIFPIVLMNSNQEKRNRVRALMARKGVQTSVHYPAVHLFSIYNQENVKLPNTEYVSCNEITLPMYAKLTENQIKYISDVLNEAIENSEC